MDQLLTWLICLTIGECVFALHDRKKKNSESQVRLGESSVFLHEYLIDVGSKIAWRETAKIKEGKTLTTEAGRQGKV